MMSEETVDLKGYKAQVAPVTKATLELNQEEGELVFSGRTQRGYEIDFDAKVEWGCMPTESLILSLGACMAIDMVSFLRKMRAEIKGYRMAIEGQRNDTPPQYYKVIDLKITITGKGLDKRKVERAISLSQEKYCSVYHTLRPDLVVNVSYDLLESD
jgi:putative redox protein